MMFPILIREDAPFTREQITLHLEERRIETRPMVSILDQPYYQERFGVDLEERYPVARWIDRRGFYIGCHPELTDAMVSYVLETFEEFLREASTRGAGKSL
jgi:dTDP-4-amino-4,6-dideoxygalactose transaminase